MLEVRNSEDLELRRDVHLALLHALENPLTFLQVNREHTSAMHWAELRAAYRLGLFRQLPSGKKNN